MITPINLLHHPPTHGTSLPPHQITQPLEPPFLHLSHTPRNPNQNRARTNPRMSCPPTPRARLLPTNTAFTPQHTRDKRAAFPVKAVRRTGGVELGEFPAVGCRVGWGELSVAAEEVDGDGLLAALEGAEGQGG